MVRVLTRFVRAVVPLLVLIGGIASVYYGARYNAQEVVEEQEIKVPIAPPTPFGPMAPPEEQPPFGDPSPFGQPPPFGNEPPLMEPSPLLGPAPFPMEVTETVLIGKDESELQLIREVTFGGVVLLASGELRRTYSGAPPSLCPT
jgi:hypothetical protein